MLAALSGRGSRRGVVALYLLGKLALFQGVRIIRNRHEPLPVPDITFQVLLVTD